MPADLWVHLSFLATPTPAAIVMAVIALVCGGWAFHAALQSTTSPNWLRADAAVVAVALYAFAFGRLQVIDSQSAVRILAYAVGFLAATIIEPLHARLVGLQEPDRRD
ncbi:MAG: hypothetical protein MNPFHGCM_02932 [Gemmatimonadaceae bacterium]|nr:hypothetical protein [Gemmatimonadaceae bacterium]